MERLLAHLAGRTRVKETSIDVGSRTYRILRPASPEALLDDAEFDEDERIPYWAELWPSAIALARYLKSRDLSGSRAIELGCGVGLSTVAALESGAEVLATDYYRAALDFAAENVRRNTGCVPETMLLDWRRPPRSLPRFDIVLAADVLYERENAEMLALLVPRLLAPGGEALVSDPQRKNAVHFLRAMEERGFQHEVQSIPVERGEEEVEVLVHRFIGF